MAGMKLTKEHTIGSLSARYPGIDYFRMAAAFMVIAIHIGPFADWNEDLDFLLTYCAGRTAVPFFFMTTGYFVLAPYVRSGFRKKRSFYKYILKNTGLYLAVTVLYLPLAIYSGNLPHTITGFMKALFFDGTFYHLWYFPAAILGSVLLAALLRMSVMTAMLFSVTAYVIGSFGDSCYGVTEQFSVLKSIYDGIFCISSYTRNGIFFAPVFLLLGMLLARARKLCSKKECVCGTMASLLLMMGEGFLTYSLGWQRHNSMYIFLLPTMFFLFQLLLNIQGKAPAFCRNGSIVLYVIHPAVIVVLRGAAKGMKLTDVLVDRLFVQYLSVCVLSLMGAFLFCRLKKMLGGNGYV